MKTIGCAILLAACSLCHADNLTFIGHLVTPPVCTISNNARIDVNFRDVIITRIDGNNYRQPLEYKITCDSSVRDNSMAMTLTLTGDVVDFDDAAIKTNADGLGIKIWENNQPFKPGSTITVDEANLPVLEAVPVKSVSANLSEQNFEVRATLRVDYQ